MCKMAIHRRAGSLDGRVLLKITEPCEKSLRKLVNRQSLTYIQLQSVLKEIESTVNFRPLVYVCDDIDSTSTLTPGHFLTLNSATGVPVLEYENDADYNPYESTAERFLQTWKKGQKLLAMFWKM